MKDGRVKTVDTVELEAGEDEEIDDDDGAEKRKNSVKRVKTGARTNVPTSCKIDGTNGAYYRRCAVPESCAQTCSGKSAWTRRTIGANRWSAQN